MQGTLCRHIYIHNYVGNTPHGVVFLCLSILESHEQEHYSTEEILKVTCA